MLYHRLPVKGLLAIDPGPDKSAYVLMTMIGEVISYSNDCENNDLIEIVRRGNHSVVACESVQSYGMPVGQSTFQTCFMIGRIHEATEFRGIPFIPYMNPDIRLHLCKSSKAKDTNVRRALLDRYERTGGGATPEIGTIKKQGPLYGFSGNHAFSALAVGWTYLDRQKHD